MKSLRLKTYGQITIHYYCKKTKCPNCTWRNCKVVSGRGHPLHIPVSTARLQALFPFIEGDRWERLTKD